MRPSRLSIASTAVLSVLVLLVVCPAFAVGDENAAIRIFPGPDWVAARPELDIVPGSALDFSRMGLTEAPAGKHGFVIAREDGQFAFSDSPRVVRRFYGVNFCFSSLYLPHEQADRVAERLMRLGYNAFRIHHYEGELTRGQPRTTQLNPEKLDQLDYLVAALIRRGIYITTDLFVSRPVPYKQVGIDREGQIPMDTYKILVPVLGGAFENWKEFSRALLGHTNAYTGRRYADEPALAWIAMINEGNFGNFFRDIKTIPEWKQAWNGWLRKRYSTRDNLASTWGAGLKTEENPESGSVDWPEKLNDAGGGLRTRDCVLFLSDTERDMVSRMKKFLREDLGCRALVSNSSSWTRFTTDQAARQVYDYVDDHFYVDHPQFLEGSWRLPSRCPNTSPIAEGAPGGRSITFTRLFDKPFTVTEYNYSGPGRFRGVGGILTGAMGALQGWGGIWRFAYSHSSQNLIRPAPMGYFDMATDPLSQAAERASICLFLRGDLKPAPHSVALAMTDADLARPAARIPTLAPGWHWLAWVTRIGSHVTRDPGSSMPESLVLPLGWQTPSSGYKAKSVFSLNPYSLQNTQLIAEIQRRGIVKDDRLPRPSEKYFRSETGEVTIDGPRNIMVLDTGRTAGGYAPAGQCIDASASKVKIRVLESDATVWVSALDKSDIRKSKHLLVTHLTDLQNTGIRYAESERKTLQHWGEMPYLVRKGRAEVQLPLAGSKRFHVWALSNGGTRLAEVPANPTKEGLSFVADVAGHLDSGARMIYEIGLE